MTSSVVRKSFYTRKLRMLTHLNIGIAFWALCTALLCGTDIRSSAQLKFVPDCDLTVKDTIKWTEIQSQRDIELIPWDGSIVFDEAGTYKATMVIRVRSAVPCHGWTVVVNDWRHGCARSVGHSHVLSIRDGMHENECSFFVKIEEVGVKHTFVVDNTPNATTSLWDRAQAHLETPVITLFLEKTHLLY